MTISFTKCHDVRATKRIEARVLRERFNGARSQRARFAINRFLGRLTAAAVNRKSAHLFFMQ